MAFSFVDYTKGTPGEGMLNPLQAMLKGYQNSQQLKLNNAKIMQEQAAAKYADDKLAAEIQKSKAETRESSSRSDLYGQQAKYYPDTAKADIEAKNALSSLQRKEAQHYDERIAAEIAEKKAQAGKISAMLGIIGQGNDINQPLNLQGSPGRNIPQQNGGMPGVQGAENNSQQYPVNQPNQVHGIETPKPTREDLIYKALFGIDTFGNRQDQAKTRQLDQNKQIQEAITSTSQQANTARQLVNTFDNFNNAMNKAQFTGSYWGTVPSKGSKWAMAYDMSNDQLADMYATQALPQGVAQLRSEMKTGQFSNLDMEQASNLNFDRTMEPAVREQKGLWLRSVADRMDEQKRFYAAMAENPNITKQNMDVLWSEYQSNFPLWKDGKARTDNLGNWPLYTTPKALEEIRRTGGYKPSARDAANIMVKMPDGQILPIKRGKLESVISKVKGVEILS